MQVPFGVVPGLGSAMMPGVADQYAQQAMLAQMQAQQGQPGMHTVMVQSLNGAYGPAYPSPLAPSPYAHQLPSGSAQVAATGMQQIILQSHEQHSRSPAIPTSAARTPFKGPWHPATPRPPPPLAWLPPPGTPGTPPQGWKPANSPARHRDSAGVPVYIRVNKRITASKAIDEVLELVRTSAADFDAVCMATALHKMASLDADPQQYKLLGDRPELTRLKDMILKHAERFSARNIANTLWALAKMMHNPGDAFLNSLGVEAGKKVTDFNAQNHANTVWAFATLGHNPGTDVLRVMAKDAEGKVGKFTAQNMSNTLLAYAKLEHHPGHLMEVMAAEALRKLDTFTPQALSNTVWGFSKLEVVHEKLLDAVAAIALRKLQSFNGQNIANTVWAYANLGYDPGALMDAIAQCSEYRMQEFSPQNISNILWAYAKLGKLHPELMEAAALHSCALMTTFQPQSIANIIWAYATLAHRPPSDFLTVLCGHALHELPNFSPQNISNTIWALATLKYTDRALMQAVEVEVTARLGMPEEAIKFSRQHLANSLWAMATLELLPSGRLLAAVAEAMKERASDCNPQEISNTVWAFAKLSFYSEGMMDRFASEAEGRIQEFSQQNLANMAWAFGKLTHDAPSLLDAIGLKATTIVKDLSLQHITNILWTYASFLHDVPDMLPAFTSQILERSHKEQFNAQQLSNLLWSLCILQSCDGMMWRRIMQQFTSLGMPPENLPEEALTQIYQASKLVSQALHVAVTLAYLLMKTDQEGVEVPLGEGLLEHAQLVWIESCKNIRVSGLHRDVARVLTSMGLSHTIEQLTDDSLFSVDIALAGEKVAVEVDGPHHFTANGQRPLGEMRARHRLLDVRGWSVLSVPYFLWAKQADDAAHILFLRQEINKARQHQARLLDRPSLSSNRQPDPTSAHPDDTPMEVDSQPAPQHSIAIKDDDDSAPLQHESHGPMAVDNLMISHSNTVTTPMGQGSVGVKRSASDTDLVSDQVPKVAKLEQQPQTAHAAGQSGVAGESVTAQGAKPAGQAADTARQNGPAWPTAATRGVPRTQQASTPDATPAENMALGVCEDLKPVKLERSPVVIADPSESAKGLGSSVGLSSSARDNYRPGLQLNTIPKSNLQSSLAKGASAAAATSAAASPPLALASAALEPLQSKMFHPVHIKMEDEQASTGMNAQLSPESNSAPETRPLPRTQGVTQTQIKGEQLHEALGQQTGVKCTAQTDMACDMGQAQVALTQVSARAAVQVKAETTGRPIGKQAEHGHTSKGIGTAAEHQSLVQSLKPPSPVVVVSSVNPHAGVQIPRDGVKAECWGVHPQPQSSAGQVIARGIRMLHPGLGPALSPGNLPFLESAISDPTAQAEASRSQPAVPSIKLLDSVVGQALCEGKTSFVAVAKAAPIVVKDEAKHEAKREASMHDPASSFQSLNLSALLDRRKQELLGLARGRGENKTAVGPNTVSIGSAASLPLPMPSTSTDAVPDVDDGKTDLKAAVTQPSVRSIGEPEISFS
ncbi:TPA: hypothetical protein ACH3X1_015560 [Trebouxia sp. C0004]